jgi:hypothetical protein
MKRNMGQKTTAIATDKPKLTNDTVNVSSQMKGGVGKSFVATCLSQYYQHAQRPAISIDTDSGNPTFSRFKSLNVEHMNITEDGEINPRLFDGLMEKFLTNNGPFVVDTGSTAFLSFWNYVIRTGAFDILRNEMRSPLIHVPIAPAPDLDDTLTGFAGICQHVPDGSIVAWLNQKERLIQLNGKDFTELDIVRENAAKLRGVVVVSNRTEKLHRADVSDMLCAHQTFDERIGTAQIMVKARLRQVQTEIFSQLEEIGL